jgi:hypothetical protein
LVTFPDGEQAGAGVRGRVHGERGGDEPCGGQAAAGNRSPRRTVAGQGAGVEQVIPTHDNLDQ